MWACSWCLNCLDSSSASAIEPGFVDFDSQWRYPFGTLDDGQQLLANAEGRLQRPQSLRQAYPFHGAATINPSANDLLATHRPTVAVTISKHGGNWPSDDLPGDWEELDHKHTSDAAEQAPSEAPPEPRWLPNHGASHRKAHPALDDVLHKCEAEGGKCFSDH